MTHSAGLSNVNFYYVPAQGGYHLIPMPAAQPPVAPALQLPVLRSVDATGRRSLQRSALAPVQNLPTLEPQPLATSLPAGLEKMLIDKIAEHRKLASMRTDRQIENDRVSTTVLVQSFGSPDHPSNLFYTRLPNSYVPAPLLQGELPPVQRPPQPQQGAIPVAAGQALPQQQQGAQPSLKRQAAGEPGHLNFRGTTPVSYKAAQQARAEKRAKAPQQGLPKPQPAVPKIPAHRKKTTQPKAKPAAAGLDLKKTLTPATYIAESAKKTRRHFIDPHYATSKDVLQASQWIEIATKSLIQKEYTEAVTALQLAYKSLPEDGFIYKLLVELGSILINTDPRISTSIPEEDLDVLVLRGIYKIKHGKFEEAKTDLQKVLTHNPNDQLARLIFNQACELINRPTPQSRTSNESTENVTNYDSVKLG